MGDCRHAGQSNFPRIVCRPIRLAWKKRRRPVLFRHEEKRFSLMDSPLSQHKKRSLPSYIRYFPFALVNCPVTPILTYFQPRWNLAANQRAQHCAGKGRRQSVNEYSGWCHRMARSYGIAVGLLVWKLEITIFIAEVNTVYHGPLDCVSWLLCLSRRYKVFQANILMLYF